MAPKIKWTEESHLDAATLAVIERGEVSQQSDPALYKHLREVCDACDDFMITQSLKDTDDYDLTSKEAEQILGTILDEIEEDRLRMARAAAAPTLTKWDQLQQWFWGWRATAWAVPAAMAMLFLLIPDSFDPRTKATPADANGCKGCQEGGTGAFLHITVARQRAKGQHTAFEQGSVYAAGDALLFRFQIINDGYVLLLRQDQQGYLEQIYPFPKRGPLRVRSGKNVELRHKGQPLAYYIEAKHQGAQTFRLVHVPKPMTFPSHIDKLTGTQKKLLAQADHMRCQVQATPRRIK